MAFAVIGVSLIQLVGEYLFTQRTRDDQRIADQLSEQLGDYLVAFDMDGMYRVASETALAEQSRVLLLDPLCVVQMDTLSEINGARFITQEVRNVLDGASSDYGFYDMGRRGTLWFRTALTAFSQVDSRPAYSPAASTADRRSRACWSTSPRFRKSTRACMIFK